MLLAISVKGSGYRMADLFLLSVQLAWDERTGTIRGGISCSPLIRLLQQAWSAGMQGGKDKPEMGGSGARIGRLHEGLQH